MNRTLKHIWNNKKTNLEVIIVLSIILVIQLYLVAELWSSFYPEGNKVLSESCYSFVVNNPNETNLNDLMVVYPKDMIVPLDIQFVGTGVQNHAMVITAVPYDEEKYKELISNEFGNPQDIRLYAPLTPFSEKRINNIGTYDSLSVNNGSVVLVDNVFDSYSKSKMNNDKYVYIAGSAYKISGGINVYEVEWNEEIQFKFISNVKTVLKSTSNYEIIFQFDKPLKPIDYSRLSDYVDSKFEVIDTKLPYTLNQKQTDDAKTYTLIILSSVVLCLFLTMSFIWYVLENRQKEFRVYLICGSSYLYIVKQIILHISVLCIVAELIGWCIFFLIINCTRMVALKTVPFGYAFINSISFWFLLLIVMSVFLMKDFIQKQRLGLSRITR